MFGLSPLPRTLPAALADLEHKKPAVRRSALADLVRLCEGAAREPALRGIERALASDQSAEVRAQAALALADVGGREARAGLERALSDPSVQVRERSLLALAELSEPGDERLLAVAKELAAAAEPSLRLQALIALVRLSPESAEQALLRASSDEDPELRAMAFRLAEERMHQGIEVSAALVSSARARLDDPASAARASAALFLGARGDRTAEVVLLALIEGRLPGAPPSDVQAAAELAGELGIAASTSGLRRLAFGPFGARQDGVGWHARVALARLGDQRAINALVRGLSAWTRDARTLAVAAVGKARLRVARTLLLELRGQPERVDPEAVALALAEIDASEGGRGSGDG